MSLKFQQFAGASRARLAFAACAASALLAATTPSAAAQDAATRRLQERLEDASRKEAELLLSLVDAAMAGHPRASDFTIGWRNDFLKADPGTLVPFTLTIDRSSLHASSALLYVRAVRRDRPRPLEADKGPAASRYAFDAIFAVDFGGDPTGPIRITRGLAVPAGEYDVYVALRERPPNPLAGETRALKAGLLRVPLRVPDFWTGSLATSTIVLASRIEALPAPISPDEVLDRPYAVGTQEIVPADGVRFPRHSELIIVFLIYNQQFTEDRGFDLSVDYHVFRRTDHDLTITPGGDSPLPPARPGEAYVTRTTPQRFNPTTMGGVSDRGTAQPVMAGQGILLSSFEEGDYRIGITVTDLLSRTSISRDVTFTVVGS